MENAARRTFADEMAISSIWRRREENKEEGEEVHDR